MARGTECPTTSLDRNRTFCSCLATSTEAVREVASVGYKMLDPTLAFSKLAMDTKKRNGPLAAQD